MSQSTSYLGCAADSPPLGSLLFLLALQLDEVNFLTIPFSALQHRTSADRAHFRSLSAMPVRRVQAAAYEVNTGRE